MTAALPAAIQRFIDTTNAGDSAGFLDCFTQDAFLSDWGRDFSGREGIAQWNGSDNIGQKSRLTITRLDQAGTSYAAIVTVRGNGFNGTGTMTFTLEGEAIARLIIS